MMDNRISQRGQVKGFVIIGAVLAVLAFGALYGVKQMNAHQDVPISVDNTTTAEQPKQPTNNTDSRPKQDDKTQTNNTNGTESKKDQIRSEDPSAAGSANTTTGNQTQQGGNSLPTTGPNDAAILAFAVAVLVAAGAAYYRSTLLV